VNLVTLVFESEDTDEHEHVQCRRLRQAADAVRPGDFIACPYAGFIHVHRVRSTERLTYIADCHDIEHVYRSSEELELARPTTHEV